MAVLEGKMKENVEYTEPLPVPFVVYCNTIFGVVMDRIKAELKGMVREEVHKGTSGYYVGLEWDEGSIESCSSFCGRATPETYERLFETKLEPKLVGGECRDGKIYGVLQQVYLPLKEEVIPQSLTNVVESVHVRGLYNCKLIYPSEPCNVVTFRYTNLRNEKKT